MPVHIAYGDIFGGGLNVLVNKPAVEFEVANDLNYRLMNAFRVLRDEPDKLIDKIALSPWHDGERLLAREQSPDPIEDARRVWCGINMSIIGNTDFTKNGGFRWPKTPNNGETKNYTPKGINLEPFYRFAARLKNVHFVVMDAIDLIKLLSGRGYFLYVDPPYFSNDRARKAAYSHEANKEFHENLVNVLLEHKGDVMLSGYRTSVYEPLEQAGWQRIERPAVTNSGGTKIECIWVNYSTEKQQSIF